MKRVAVAILLAACCPGWSQVRISQEGDRIDVEIDGKPFTSMYYGAEWGRPFLHPLRAASGTVVTRGYPMEQVDGEERDHPHHTGVWFTHDDVNGYQFWLNSKSSKSQRVSTITVNRIRNLVSGEKTGSISAQFDWRKPDAAVLLTEDRVMTFHSDPRLRIVDFDITLNATETVKFGDTKEGTFGLRLATPMNEAHGGRMVNAEGLAGEKSVWGKPSAWVDYSGRIGEETLGVTIMDHPSNPKHPTYWHARGYGLFAANIFGERDFFADKTRDGSVTIDAGKSLRFRYRVLVHPGDTASLPLAQLYREYAAGN